MHYCCQDVAGYDIEIQQERGTDGKTLGFMVGTRCGREMAQGVNNISGQRGSGNTSPFKMVPEH